MIDRSLVLEDRIQAAGSIIRRGGPTTLMESALVDDAASRLAGARPDEIVKYRPPRPSLAARCHASAACSITVALVVLVAIIQYWLPGKGLSAADRQTSEVMQAVADELEKSTTTIEQSLKPDTQTAAIARQQSNLARALKESASQAHGGRTGRIDRSQALKELSSIAEKLGSRKNELENTRAPEIVSLAERRFQSALSGTATSNQSQAAQHQATGNARSTGKAGKPDKANTTANNDGVEVTDRRNGHGIDHNSVAKPKSTPVAGQDSHTARDSNTVRDGQAPSEKATPPAKDLASVKAENELASQDKQITSARPGVAERPADAAQPPDAVDQRANRADSKPGDYTDSGTSPASKSGDGQLDSSPTPAASDPPSADPGAGQPPGGLSKVLPNISEDLMKKAAEMRANNLTPGDVEQLRKAAEGLLKDLSAKDLANLANSKEIQQTLEQLARQVNPQQMEELARQLLSQKEVRDELQAIGKLLVENRQAKETIAGFADKAREIAGQLQEQGFKPPVPPEGLRPPPGLPGLDKFGVGVGRQSGGRVGGSRNGVGRDSSRNESLAGTGRFGESGKRSARPEDLGGGSNTGGEPIYGRVRPGTAAARVPYSSAYPSYRREADRSVQRSQVPGRMRDLIRNYFDAINPDSEKHP